MKALTLTPPWGNAVACWDKDVENRTWVPPADLVGRDIVIHQGARWTGEDASAAAMLADELAESFPGVPTTRDGYPSGIVAVARLAGYVVDVAAFGKPLKAIGYQFEAWTRASALARAQVVGFPGQADAVRAADLVFASRWWIGPVGWLLADVRRVYPVIACPGAQGLWTVPDDAAAELVRRGLVTAAGPGLHA